MFSLKDRLIHKVDSFTRRTFAKIANQLISKTWQKLVSDFRIVRSPKSGFAEALLVTELISEIS